jgi:ATP-dependent RNA helicase DOB1
MGGDASLLILLIRQQILTPPLSTYPPPGNVILMLDAKMEPAVAKAMIKGAPDALTSAFGLRESMLLGLARVEGASPEALLAQSFRQWQAKRALPALQARAEALAARRDAVVVEGEADVEDLLDLVGQRAALGEQLRAATVARSDVALRFLQPGRLVRVAPGPPEAGRPLPQLGPVPKGASLDDGDAAEGADAAGSGSSSSDDEGGGGNGGEGSGGGPTLADILQLLDG